MSALEDLFHRYLIARGLDGKERGVSNYLKQNHQFTIHRKYELDFALPFLFIAFEIQGGTFIKGGHSSPRGILRDYEKFNHATALGWSVYLLSKQMVEDWHYLDSLVEEALKLRLELPNLDKVAWRNFKERKGQI